VTPKCGAVYTRDCGHSAWSIYGAKRAQPVATGRKCDRRINGSNRPIGNQWQPTATVSERMVRRGSTVRVRQRASRNPRNQAILARGRSRAGVDGGPLETIWKRDWRTMIWVQPSFLQRQPWSRPQTLGPCSGDHTGTRARGGSVQGNPWRATGEDVLARRGLRRCSGHDEDGQAGRPAPALAAASEEWVSI
jgi:hypothetical protein